ncbi:hypothetical protein M501DRAFT_1053069 [Patellaria atrata CBS 101060]|uniref:DUF6536 domain-containing protein n=1 Tax=Patellaria atrata CBS 101060 TaxID=1346257 RepID=A0A9P4VS70_9PEZI|nr:hypothetical protein M501DRAFT_1053069 [Patellaria atrata CBS 101060]
MVTGGWLHGIALYILSKVYSSIPSYPQPTSESKRSRNPFIRFDQYLDRSFSGWKSGTIAFATCAIISMLLNLGFTIFAGTRYNISNGIGTLYQGSCDQTKNTSLWMHLAINALSSILLSGSNYCMQCLSAPTRGDIDISHAKGQWMDIGIPSVRNLMYVNRRRKLLWWALGISSVPLHLLYNSAIFVSTSAYATSLLEVDEKFLNNRDPFCGEPNWNNDTLRDCPVYQDWWATYYDTYYDEPSYGWDYIKRLQTKFSTGRLDVLDNENCIKEFSKEFITSRKAVIMVGNTKNGINGTGEPWYFQNGSYPGFIDGYSLFFMDVASVSDSLWVCYGNRITSDQEMDKESCSKAEMNALLAHPEKWAPATTTVEYCLSEPVEEKCTVQFHIGILSIVIICNLIKAAAMVASVYSFGSLEDSPLLTLGDAVASFMERPDDNTRGICLATKTSIDTYQTEVGKEETPRPYETPVKHWIAAISRKRWYTTLVLTFIAFIVCVWMLGWSIKATAGPKDIKSLWDLGFGGVSTGTMISTDDRAFPTSLLGVVLLANLPQTIFSFIYLTYNGLYTCMLAAEEWSGFIHERKGLRVSAPKGAQRSTYALQLPYRYGIPFVMVSGLMHWLVSQSLFLVKIDKYNPHEVPIDRILTCGFSPIAIIFVVIIGGLMIVALIVTSRRRYKPGMPLVGSCSFAIAAACHPPEKSSDSLSNSIGWGEVPTLDGEVGHCSFSSGPLRTPTPGKLYA